MKLLALLARLGMIFWGGKKAGVAAQKAADVAADTVALKDRVHVETEVAATSAAAVDDELSKFARG